MYFKKMPGTELLKEREIGKENLIPRIYRYASFFTNLELLVIY